MSRLLNTLLLLPLLLPAVSVTAQTAPEAPPLYRIELLVFERPGEALEEKWPEEPGAPDPRQAIGSLSMPMGGMVFVPQTSEPVTAPSGIEPVLPVEPVALPPLDSQITLLPMQEDGLQAAAYSLRVRGMQPLLHLVWQQPVEDREAAKGLWVQEGKLNGLVKVSLGRYLHLDLDLLLNNPQTAERYRFVDHRRMRSEQLNHLDHPKLGVLAVITPVKLEIETSVTETAPTQPETGSQAPAAGVTGPADPATNAAR